MHPRVWWFCLAGLPDVWGLNVSVIGIPGSFAVEGRTCGTDNVSVGNCPDVQESLPFGYCCGVIPQGDSVRFVCLPLRDPSSPPNECVHAHPIESITLGSSLASNNSSALHPKSALNTTTPPSSNRTALQTVIPVTKEPPSALDKSAGTLFWLGIGILTFSLLLCVVAGVLWQWRPRHTRTSRCSFQPSSPVVAPWIELPPTPPPTSTCPSCGIAETDTMLLLDTWDNLSYCKPCMDECYGPHLV
ncbi:Aste57867_22377 [Aphanomyces stellatus]|uniref:Aste57867_22377 protein n=1 Tax=Aphanomyces stellatus TaxID=120398 RepID=A0A485LLA3_9STRA|nr:hypothetical protein As57867_022307 [Aphanomyces stellatus]VFT99040.1 Aste57867_22377 [Aphanomyces stellatus]